MDVRTQMLVLRRFRGPARSFRPWTSARMIGKSQRGGTKGIVRSWGGRKTYYTIERPLQNQLWRPRKIGFVWSVPFSSKENDRREQRGEGKYHKWGGSKTFFGEGLYGMFSPLLSFPAPFVFSEMTSRCPRDICPESFR